MHTGSRALLLAAALVAAPAGFAADGYDDGDPIPADKGVLLLKVERERTAHAAVSRRGASQIELRMVGSSERVTLGTPSRLKGIVVPPGRYYLYSLREIEGGMSATGISNASEAFEVRAGKASWVGTMGVSIGASGTRVELKQGEPELAELKDKFEELHASGNVLRAAMGGDAEPLVAQPQP